MKLVSRSAAALTCAAIVSASSAALAQGNAIDRTIDSGHARVLQLETAGGDLHLIPDGPAGQVRVRIEQNGASAGTPQVEPALTGNRLTIAIGGAGGRSLVPFAAASSTAYTIDYPPSLRLDVRAASGNVLVEKPAAPVEIYDASGDIAIDAPRATVTAETTRGNVSVTGALGTVDLASDNGDVAADLLAGWSGADVRMQSANGAIHLTLPAGFRGRFDASSDTGKVHNDFGPSTAKAPLVWLYAANGDVTISAAH